MRDAAVCGTVPTMPYELGIDFGTTFTAAAVHRGGHVEIATLGSRAAAVPTVIFLREDETILVGEAANRRGVTEPSRVAREFKRRIGDPTPVMLGGTPYSAEALTAKLLRWVVDAISEREGGPARRIALSHPANWGAYKKDLLDQAVHLADLPEVVTVTEPQAAAMAYAASERVEPGTVVAVYDLGGGTFDAAVLRKTDTGFEHLGSPEGIERLGGIDFDEAVFAHVAASVGGAMEQLDPGDPGTLAAVARLRTDCVDAKEALSADSDTSIPVLLPNVQTEVRLTRAEFEAMIRPTLADTIAALRRALRSAQLEPANVDVVLLVGGSSRIPLVAQLVSAELGRPVAVDAHPKHAIATGAALTAAAAVRQAQAATEGGAERGAAGAAEAAVSAAPAAAHDVEAETALRDRAAEAEAEAGTEAEAEAEHQDADHGEDLEQPVRTVRDRGAAPPAAVGGPSTEETTATPHDRAAVRRAARPPVGRPATAVTGKEPKRSSRRPVVVGVAALAVVLLSTVGLVLARGGDGESLASSEEPGTVDASPTPTSAAGNSGDTEGSTEPEPTEEEIAESPGTFVPDDWQEVSYDGLSAFVPSGWSEDEDAEAGGVTYAEGGTGVRLRLDAPEEQVPTDALGYVQTLSETFAVEHPSFDEYGMQAVEHPGADSAAVWDFSFRDGAVRRRMLATTSDGAVYLMTLASPEVRWEETETQWGHFVAGFSVP